jgi:hypothetical protein
MEGDIESNQGLLARRSARIVLALLLAVVLSFFALLTLEHSGASPVRPLTNISSNGPGSRSPAIQNDGSTTSSSTTSTTVKSHGDCDDNDRNVVEGTPQDKDPQGECVISGS